MAEALEEMWGVYFQKDDGTGQNLEDPLKPKKLFMFDNTDGVVWHCVEETDKEDMDAMIGHLYEDHVQFAIMVIPKTACTADENGMLTGITFPSEFTGFAGS